MISRIKNDGVEDEIPVPAEHRLFWAILVRCLRDLYGSDKRDRAEAKLFVSTYCARGDRNEPFSFAWLCVQLGLNVDQTSQRMLEVGELDADRIRTRIRGPRPTILSLS